MNTSGPADATARSIGVESMLAGPLGQGVFTVGLPAALQNQDEQIVEHLTSGTAAKTVPAPPVAEPASPFIRTVRGISLKDPRMSPRRRRSPL